MLDDPKARVAITDFYKQWIGTSRLDITTKSATLFPAYSDAVRDGMRLETPAFVEYVLWTGDRKLETLLTSPLAFVTSALAPIYGVTAPAGQRHHPADGHAARQPGPLGHPDAGRLPGRAGPPRPDVAGAARQVRADAR